MSVLVDAVRSASRTRRYARLRRADGQSARRRILRALFLWGTPALAPTLALFAVAAERDRMLFEVGLGLLVLALLAHTVGKPRLTGFDLLHQPSRRGVVLGHLLNRVPLLAWCGLMAATTWLVLMPALTQLVSGTIALAAVVLAPLAFAVSAGAARVAGRAGRDETASVMAFLFPLAGWEFARIFELEHPSPWLLPVAGAALGLLLIIQTRSVLATFRKTAAVALATAVVAVPSSPEGPWFVADDPMRIAVGSGVLVCCLIVLGMGLRTQLVCIDLAEVVETSPSAEDDAPATARPSAPVRRERAGAGLWKARLRYVADEWLPDADQRRSVPQTVSAWGGSSIILLATVLRGPILAGLAVGLTKPEMSLVWLAVLAGCFAGRVSAVDTTELQPRLWLLGVDYRDQVLHGLRALFAFAALPTLAVALVTLVIAGPADPGRQAMVLVVGATLLLRAGLPGLWPLQETHRLRLVLIWAGLLALAVAYEAWWTPLEAMRAAAVVGALGVVLLVVRLVRLREPHVAECVRRSAEP